MGGSINLMPLSMLKKVVGVKVHQEQMNLILADGMVKAPHAIIKDVTVKIDKFIFSVGFVILDNKEDQEFPFIIGRPFLEIARASSMWN
jgi:hypothetical protein